MNEKEQIRCSKLYCLNRDDGYHAPGQLLSNSRENDISGDSNNQAGDNNCTSSNYNASGNHGEDDACNHDGTNGGT